MQNKIESNGIEIEYSNDIISKIIEAYGLPADAVVSEQDIINFVKDSFSGALDKGYGIVEEKA